MGDSHEATQDASLNELPAADDILVRIELVDSVRRTSHEHN